MFCFYFQIGVFVHYYGIIMFEMMRIWQDSHRMKISRESWKGRKFAFSWINKCQGRQPNGKHWILNYLFAVWFQVVGKSGNFALKKLSSAAFTRADGMDCYGRFETFTSTRIRLWNCEKLIKVLYPSLEVKQIHIFF